MTTKDAISQLQKALAEDEGYRQSWAANIACSAMDEGVDHATAKRLAERFLALLCAQSESTP